MVKLATLHSELLQRVDRIENAVSIGFKEIEDKLASATLFFQIFNTGLSSYATQLVNNSQVTALHQRIIADKELRYPHRKILESLLSMYDHSSKQFRELSFSMLVRHARVGKNAAKNYLALLESKKLIAKRTDGYRIFFKIRSLPEMRN